MWVSAGSGAMIDRWVRPALCATLFPRQPSTRGAADPFGPVQPKRPGRSLLVLWHWGANNSFRNFVIADPAHGRAIVVLTK